MVGIGGDRSVALSKERSRLQSIETGRKPISASLEVDDGLARPPDIAIVSIDFTIQHRQFGGEFNAVFEHGIKDWIPLLVTHRASDFVEKSLRSARLTEIIPAPPQRRVKDRM